MTELIASIVGLVLIALAAGLASRPLGPAERRWVWWAALAHVVGSVAKVLIVYYYYRDGDMHSYVRFSRHIADIVQSDPGQWLWPYAKLGLQFPDVRVPYLPPGDTGSTRTMYVLAAFHQAVFGPNRFGISLFVAAFSLASKVAVYRVFREHLPVQYRRRLAIATLLIPSAVFWSASLSKEGVLWMTCGWVLYGFHLAAFRGRVLAGAVLMVLAGIPTALVKAYVLLPMAIGAAVWLYVRSEQRRTRTPSSPLRTMASAVAIFGVASLLVVGIGEVFPRYKVQNFAEEAEGLQSRAYEADQGSGYAIPVTRGVVSQLLAAPVAAATTLYRPLIFEARSPLMFANAIETTLFLFLTFYVIWERGIGVLRVVMRSPALMFCLVHVLIFAVAVGLTSTNLGTLSRYRMPMMPYFGILFAVVLPMPKPRPPIRPRRRPRSATVVPLHAA